MSLQQIGQYLEDAHQEVETALNKVKSALDTEISRAHVAIGAAMAAGLQSPEIEAIAGMLTTIDSDGNQLIEKLAATMSKITEQR